MQALIVTKNENNPVLQLKQNSCKTLQRVHLERKKKRMKKNITLFEDGDKTQVLAPGKIWRQTLLR